MGYYSQGRAPKGGFMSAIGKIGGAVVGFATGGIPGAIKGHIAGGKVGNMLQPRSTSTVVPTRSSIVGTAVANSPAGIIARGASAAYNALTGNKAGSVEMVNGQCPVGYHPNKQAGPKGPARSYCVRNRSMNPANGRAIGRAATRIKKGAAQYAKVLRVLGKKSGKMVPRGRKRR